MTFQSINTPEQNVHTHEKEWQFKAHNRFTGTEKAYECGKAQFYANRAIVNCHKN